MKNSSIKYITAVLCLFAVFIGSMKAAETENSSKTSESTDINIKEFILGHLADSYEWHITDWGDKHITVPLPIILIGENSGFNVFMSSRFHHGTEEYKGFYIADSGKYKGKIVEKNAQGNIVKPWDFSMTKNVCGLLLSCAILLIVILSVANWYKKHSRSNDPKVAKGFIGLMEMFIMDIHDSIIKPCVGKNYQKFAPYLLTAFFFILINNILGLIPIFPGGANVTGNIAITMVLALVTMFMINVFGTKEYWKEIFWPDVPLALKAFPIMPIIEIVGVFTKPFALMIRLFANMLAGHALVVGTITLIFITVKMGPVMNSSMTIVSVILTIFIYFIEVLVAYLQAYIFTMLSAVFIGLAQVEPHHKAQVEKK